MRYISVRVARRLGITALSTGLALGLGFTADAGPIERPPVIGDRSVALHWQPDEDDPVWNGNTVLESLGEFTGVHPGATAVRFLLFAPNGTEAFSFAEGEGAVVRFQLSDGQVLARYPLSREVPLADLAIHGSGEYLMGGFEDGVVSVWRVSGTEPPVFHQATPPGLRRARFITGSFDPLDLRMAAISDDDSVRVFSQPGEPLFTLSTVGDTPLALAILQAPRGPLLAAGGDGGDIRVWDISTVPNTPRFRLQGHTTSVLELVVSPDGQRLASVDESGRIVLWNLGAGAITGEVSVSTEEGGPLLGYSAPDGQLLFVGLRSGSVELRDGALGSAFRSYEATAASLRALGVAPEGRRVLLGDSNGRILNLRATRCSPSVEDPICFGGYLVWRSPTTNPDDAVLLRAYNFGDSTWTFAGDTRAFHDPDSIIARVEPPNPDEDDLPDEPVLVSGPHNGIPYFYSLTRFDWQFLNGAVFPFLRTSIRDGFYREAGSSAPVPIAAAAPARSSLPLLENVYVVPNPCEVGSVPWERSGIPHLQFRNLPARARIRIYSVAGDLVRILDHAADAYGEDRASEDWDLKNSSGRYVASGVYPYQVETPSGEVVQGYLTLLR